MNIEVHKEDLDDRIDCLEAEMILNYPPADCPIKHLFTKGMYIREMTAYAGSLITSKIHKTEHPFTLSKGKLWIYNGNSSWIELSAPYTGITSPGTRRIAYIVEDCIWTTYHKYSTIKGTENVLSENEKQKIADRIEGRIIKKRLNIPLKKGRENKLCLL